MVVRVCWLYRQVVGSTQEERDQLARRPRRARFGVYASRGCMVGDDARQGSPQRCNIGAQDRVAAGIAAPPQLVEHYRRIVAALVPSFMNVVPIRIKLTSLGARGRRIGVLSLVR